MNWLVATDGSQYRWVKENYGWGLGYTAEVKGNRKEKSILGSRNCAEMLMALCLRWIQCSLQANRGKAQNDVSWGLGFGAFAVGSL